MKAKGVALTGILCALAAALSVLEWLLPPVIPSLPGARLGLANVVILFCLYTFGVKKAVMMACIRSLSAALFMRGLFAFVYSIAGGLISLAVMWALSRFKDKLSIIGVSVAGAEAFNAAQLAAGALIISDWHIFYYLPLMTLFSVASGIIVGIIAKYSIKHYTTLGV